MITQMKKFTVIELMLIIFVMACFITILYPKALEAKNIANERSAIGSIRVMMTDQETYKADNDSYATLALLKISGKIDLTVSRKGYVFTELIAKPTSDYYAVKAVPETPAKTNEVDKNATIRKTSDNGKKVFVGTSEGTVRMDPAVNEAFNKGDAEGLVAMEASKLLVKIEDGKEVEGIKNIETFTEAK